MFDMFDMFDENNIKEEYKFITNSISEDNLKNWFGDWTYKLKMVVVILVIVDIAVKR